MPKVNTISEPKALQLVKSRFRAAEKLNKGEFERFSRYYKLFRNTQSVRNYQGLAQLFVPEPYRIVKKKTAKLYNAIREVTATPEGPQDVQASQIATHTLNFIRRKLNWEIPERAAVQESRTTGLGWLKLVWLLDKEEQDKPWKGFDLSFHSADEIYLNPEATILDFFMGNVKYLLHVYEADVETLKKNPNYDVAKLRLLELRSSTGKQERTSLEQARLLKPQQAPVDMQLKKFPIIEHWGRTLNEKGDEFQSLIVIADNSLVIRNSSNPLEDILDFPIPFVPVTGNIIGKEMYPVGDIEPAESLYNELNDTRNQRMDTVTLNIDPPKEVVQGAGINEKDLVARRGWIIRSNIPNGVRFIPPEMGGVRAAIEEEQNIRGDIQQVTGVIDFAQDSDVQAGVSIDTARGAIIAKGESDVGTEDELRLLKISFRLLYRIALAYAQKFLDRTFTIRVNEQGVDTFYNVDKQAIQGNIDLDVKMRTLQDKTTDQQLNLMLFNQAKQVPGAKIGRFFTDVLQSFKENVNIAEYYEEPQPPPPETPKVSISLKGDLTPLQASEVYKTVPGVNPVFADPALTEMGREIMRGNLPEHHTGRMNDLAFLQAQQGLNSPTQPGEAQPGGAEQPQQPESEQPQL